MVETIAAGCVFLGALVLLRVGIARLGLTAFGARSEGRIRVLETRALGGRQQLHVIEVEGRRLLVGTSEAGIQRLARLPDVHDMPDCGADRAAPEAARRGAQVGRGPRLVSVLGTLLRLAPVLVVLAGLLMTAEVAWAQSSPDPTTPGGPTLSISVEGATAPGRLSDTMKIVLVLTALSVAPSILLMATCFTRILIVLALLRQAIGTATLPPNQVLVGLALMTTFYVMTPVGEAVYADSLAPYMAEEISGEVAFERGVAPVRDYLLAHTREEDLLLFVEMRGGALPEEPSEVALPVLMPAYMISEIRTAFEIGFMIYLPFLVVDLVIASMLISLGMIMLPPVMIALPFKLMLFVLVDGWNLTLSALVTGLG